MLRRVVLDVLKPYDPGKIEMSERISSLDGVDGVNVITVEMDREVENVKIIVEGPGFDYGEIESILEDMGSAIHSVDEVVTGKKIVEDVEVPSDAVSGKWLR